ncbi:hypothetical protein F5148DRAFT_1261594 [Russula earlei]|uniref:Uncharacterized protein n=1 Tax=Russula earlei TaxID=71964 RepID=A0ACC0TTR2_9AGAM|nr:hypothetical protein F5148DRAFT_1261594 [Russula earlei]
MVDYGDNQFVTLLYGDTRFATLLYGDSWFLYCTMYLTNVSVFTLHLPRFKFPFSRSRLTPSFLPTNYRHSFPLFLLPSRAPLSTSIASDVTRLATQRLPRRSWSRSLAPPSINLRHDIITIHLRLALLCSHPSPLPLVSSTCDTLPFPLSLCSRPLSNPFHRILAPLQNAMNHSPHPPLASTHGPV